jgi:hypothetical protein
VRLAGSQCGDHCTALVGQYGHVSVIRAECGVPAAEQPVQHRGNWLLSIFVHPGVIMGPVRPIKPASGLFAKQPERVKLLTSDSHCIALVCCYFFEDSFSPSLTPVPRGKPTLLHCKKKKPCSAFVAKFTALIPDLPPPIRKYFVIFYCLDAIR